MSDALLGIALRGTTSNEKFLAMDIAYAINSQTGGPVIAAWQVDELSKDWVDAFMLISKDLPKMRKGMNVIAKKKAEIIAEHKTYKPIRH